jgi:hypothetical protein
MLATLVGLSMLLTLVGGIATLGGCLLSADSRNSESHPNFGSWVGGVSVELEPEPSPAPPGHGHLRDVGLA